MAWFGGGLSSLKEQLQNFTKEVLSEEKEDSDSEEHARAKFEDKSAFEDKAAFEDAFKKQQEEISALREQNAKLQRLFMGTSANQENHSSKHELSNWLGDVEHKFDSDISTGDPANVPNGAPSTSQEEEDLHTQLALLQTENNQVLLSCEVMQRQNNSLTFQNEEIQNKYLEISKMYGSLKNSTTKGGKERYSGEKTQLELLQDQLAEIQKQKLEIEKSCEYLEEKNKHLAEENEKIMHCYEEQTRMYESLKLKIDEKELNEKRVLDSLQGQLAELEQENVKITESCERLEERIKDLTQQNEDILKKYEELSKIHESSKSKDVKDERSSSESQQAQLTESKQKELQAINTLEQRNKELAQQNDDIVEKYQILSKMYDSLKFAMEEKELNEKKLTESLQTQLRALTNEKLQITSSCNNLEERNAHLTQQKEEIRSQYQKLMTKYESLKLMMDERNLDDEKSKLKSELKSLKGELAELCKEKVEVTSTCKNLKERNVDLTQQKEKIQSQYKKLLMKYESLKLMVDEINLDDENSKLKSELKSLKGELAELCKEKSEVTSTCNNLEERIVHLTQQKEEIQSQYQKLLTKYESLKLMMNERNLDDEKSLLKSELKSLKGEVAELCKEKIEVTSTCNNLKETNVHLSQQKEEIQLQYQKLLTKYESLKLMMDEINLDDEKSKLKSELKSLKSELAELCKDKAEVTSTCKNLEERNVDLTQQKEEIQSQYQKLLMKYESLKLMMDEINLDDEKSKLKSELKSLKGELAELCKEKVEVTSTCKNLEERNVHLTQEKEEIQSQYQNLLKKYESLDLIMDEINSDDEKSKLKSDLMSLKDKLAELCKEKVEAFGACKVLEEQVSGLILQKDDLLNKYCEQSKLYEALKKEIDERDHNERTKLESLQAELAELHQEKLEATRACTQLEEQIASLTLQNEEMVRVCEKQSEMYNSLTKMMEGPKETLRLSEEENANLKSRLELLQCQLTQLQKEKVEEAENCTRLKDQIKVTKDEYNEEINKLQKDLKSSSTSEENLKGHVMELEAQVLDAQEKFLESLNRNESYASELQSVVEQTRLQLCSQTAKHLPTRQNIVNKIIHMNEKKSEHEMNVRRLQRENNKTLSEIVEILKNFDDREVQETVYGHISALEMENQVLKLRNAQLEKRGCVNRAGIDGIPDGSNEPVSINQFVDAGTSTNLEDFYMLPSFSELSAQKQALEAQVLQLQAQTDLMKKGIENREAELRKECAHLSKDLEISTDKIQELESQLQERNSKEHERLRDHLLSIEEYYTNEALRSEALVKDLQSKLAQAEEMLKHSSTAYTSASIRTNQQVEALEKQVKLTLAQKEEMQQKLQASEDKINQQAIALQNLQTVLEQFQRGKDMEVAEELRKVHSVLNLERQKQEQQLKEMAILKDQLSEARAGLTAANRLHELLDEKTKRICGLQEEVSLLNSKLANCEDKLKTARVKLEGLIEKNLIKNLIVGYFVAPNAHRPQALHIVATVLNFTHEEREKIGLDDTGSGGGGWLNKLLYPGGPPTDASNTQSLSEAFVRFLEKESMPKPNLRLLPDKQETADKSGSPSRSQSSPAIDSRRSSVHTADFLLPTFMPEADASTSILKSILKES